MPLTQSSPLPSSVPERAVPLDIMTAFSTGQTLTANGYVNNTQSQVDIGVGLWEGRLNLDLTALKVSAGDETYRFMLLASNDQAFANGNVDLIAFQDFAAASAGRLLPTVCPPSNAVPSPGKQSSRFTVPVTNKRGIFLMRYLQLYLVVGGTAPSVSLAAWLAAD